MKTNIMRLTSCFLIIFLTAHLEYSQGLKCSHSCTQRFYTACFVWWRCSKYRLTACYNCCPGWTGSVDSGCPTAICNPSCRNGGTCTRPNYCSCPSGYSSPNCAPVCFGSSTCPNGGTCTRPNYCSNCNSGHASPRCSPVCFGSTTCPHGGTCIRPGFCDGCDTGYLSPRCSPVCFGSTSCPNGGTCSRPDYCTNCDTGYTSPRCDPVCFGITSCPNGGTCTRPNYCSNCDQGYIAPQCNPVCFGSTSCPNGGTCNRPDYCTNCAEGYTPPRCDPVCFGSTSCHNGGICSSPDNCTDCNEGYVPPQCDSDGTAPDIRCYADYARTNDPGLATASVSWPVPEATDDQGVAGVTCDVQSGFNFSIGVSTVTCTATDGTGNEQTCSFDVIVIDDESPTLANCPQNFTLIVERETDEIIADWTPPTVSDNSGMVNLTTNLEPGQLLLPGQYDVTYTATDPAGQFSTCPTFTVTVESNVNECSLTAVVEECTTRGLTCINQLDGYTCDCPVGHIRSNSSDDCTQGRTFQFMLSIDAVFTNDLEDPSSLAFLKLQEQLQNLMLGVFDAMSGFGKVVVLSFRKGSIGVDVAVIYDPISPVTQADVQSTLDESIATGDFLMGSDLKIASSDVKVIEEVCVDGYCLIGGTCVPSSVNLRTCTCPSGYSGDRCESDEPGVDPTATKQESDQSNAAVIAPVVVVVVVVIGLVVAFGVVRYRRSRRLTEMGKTPQAMSTNPRQSVDAVGLNPCMAENDPEPSHDYDNFSITNASYGIHGNDSNDADLPMWAQHWIVPWSNIRVGDKVLGNGHFGQVVEGAVVIKGSSKPAAIIKLDAKASPTVKQNFMSEFQSMSNIGLHPNVVCLLGVCQHKDVLYVAMEYHPIGDLRSYLRLTRSKGDNHSEKSLSSKKLVQFALDVAKGMHHMSSLGVIHRDLAARNVTLDNSLVAKVSNFGLSRKEDVYVQTPETSDPTRLMSLESLNSKMFTSKSDVWSFGILLWEIANLGAPPYPDIKTLDLAMMLNNGYRMPKPSNCDDEIYELMFQCWDKDPNKRPTFKKVMDTLSSMAEDKDHTYLTLPLKSDDDEYVQFGTN